MAKDEVRSTLFWSKGSQAVRLPKSMHLPGSEVRIRRQGRSIVISAAKLPSDKAAWDGFRDAFPPLGKHGIRRWPTLTDESANSLALLLMLRQAEKSIAARRGSNSKVVMARLRKRVASRRTRPNF
jgi:virulence-associated protein VagC